MLEETLFQEIGDYDMGSKVRNASAARPHRFRAVKNLGKVVLAIAIFAPTLVSAQRLSSPPHSVGPNKNVTEWLALPSTMTFKADDTPGMERCLTIALSFGLGGAPVVIHEEGTTLMYSLLPNRFGLVSTMLILTHGNLEYRGNQEFERRLVKQCLDSASPFRHD